MRAFVTGGHGFVGPWLRHHLEAAGDDVIAPEDVDITDRRQVAAVLAEVRPDAIFHLAALASVADSWTDPSRTFEVNALGTLHVLDGARALSHPPRVLIVGSAEVYGAISPEQLPVTEDAALRPVTPYAASKVAAEFLGLQAHLGFGLPVIRARSFNHVGPGQGGSFVVADIARRIVAARTSGERVLSMGNLSPRRDFTDVRDVVRAYRLLIERGQPGEVYNVCSGHDVSVEQLARRLLELASADLRIETDPDLARPVDVPVLRGDPSRIRAATGWQPAISLDDTLRDVLADAATPTGNGADPAPFLVPEGDS